MLECIYLPVIGMKFEAKIVCCEKCLHDVVVR